MIDQMNCGAREARRLRAVVESQRERLQSLAGPLGLIVTYDDEQPNNVDFTVTASDGHICVVGMWDCTLAWLRGYSEARTKGRMTTKIKGWDGGVSVLPKVALQIAGGATHVPFRILRVGPKYVDGITLLGGRHWFEIDTGTQCDCEYPIRPDDLRDLKKLAAAHGGNWGAE